MTDNAIWNMVNKFVSWQREKQSVVVIEGKKRAKFVRREGKIAELTAGPRGRHLQPAGG